MGTQNVRLRGVRVVRPLRQGHYSSLCGLYSFINAVQLSSWATPASDDALRELYKFGIKYLSRRRQLARVMTMGMDQHLWLDLGAAVVTQSRDLLGMSLALAPIGLSRASRDDVQDHDSIMRKAKETLAEGRPILCGLGGTLEHYTVLCGYSEKRLTLFDSSGFHWINMSSLGHAEGSGSRHWLYPGSVTALVDAW